jgi:hypothetical protein
MTDHNDKEQALRRYVVFRVKAIEFLDVAALRKCLLQGTVRPPTPVGRTPSDFADSLRTVLLSWLVVFVDRSKGAMNVIQLWKELFRDRASEIDAAWRRMEPGWPFLRDFRNKAGFHADRPLCFFKARRAVLEKPEVDVALAEFEKIFRSILKAERKELPDLEGAVDGLLDELEAGRSERYDRSEFKRYLMVPNTRGTSRP